MTGEEVCAMMDAIYAGKYYAHSFETTPNSNSISIEVGTNNPEASNEFWFSSFDAEFLAKIDDPRIAREIAAALVTWASTKDGIIFDQLGAASKVKAMQKRQGPELPRL